MLSFDPIEANGKGKFNPTQFKLGDNSKYFEQSKSIRYFMRHLVVKFFSSHAFI